MQYYMIYYCFLSILCLVALNDIYVFCEYGMFGSMALLLYVFWLWLELYMTYIGILCYLVASRGIYTPFRYIMFDFTFFVFFFK